MEPHFYHFQTVVFFNSGFGRHLELDTLALIAQGATQPMFRFRHCLTLLFSALHLLEAGSTNKHGRVFHFSAVGWPFWRAVSEKSELYFAKEA